MLKIPAYIEKSGVVGAPIKFKDLWVDDDYPTFYRENDTLQREITKTTTAGDIALALGCLEWVAWRMSKEIDSTLVLQGIEAMWAGIISYRHVRDLHESPLCPKRKEWLGVKRGPLWSIYRQLVDLQETLPENQPASPEATSAIRFARYVMPKTTLAKSGPFEIWYQSTLKRLNRLHPKKEEGENDIGLPMTREVQDPEFDYELKDEKRYRSEFLKNLRSAKNPFLKLSK